MPRTYLEIKNVTYNWNSYDELKAEFEKEQQEIAAKLAKELLHLQIVDDDKIAQKDEVRKSDVLKKVKEYIDEHNGDLLTNDDVANFKDVQRRQDDLGLWGHEYAMLYNIRQRSEAAIQLNDEEPMSFSLGSVAIEQPEIMTHRSDVEYHGPIVKLTLMAGFNNGGPSFQVMAAAYDKPGEDKVQMGAQINFSKEELETLNYERFQRIMEWCARNGIHISADDLLKTEGMVDEDENLRFLQSKLKEYAEQYTAEQKKREIENPGPLPHDETLENINFLETDEPHVTAETPAKAGKSKPQKVKTLAEVRADMIDFLEKDIHKTRGLSYFEHRSGDMIEFSLYDKPNRDNEKLDGVKDKNGVHVPTYSHRLYIGQSETGRFKFGYATPGGRKMDDPIASDFMGVMKKTGITHLNFSNIPNQDKGVWLVACAEKGIVPIGISLNEAKVKMMVAKAREKLSREELMEFQRRLAAQYRENAELKGKKLVTSEESLMESLEIGYSFENFRKGYDDIEMELDNQIKLGAKDKQTGAAITLGAVRALETVFSAYSKCETIGDFIKLQKETEEKDLSGVLTGFPHDKSTKDLDPKEWLALYNAVRAYEVEQAHVEIKEILDREAARTPKRVAILGVHERLNASIKSLNSINVWLRQHGQETLNLPSDHRSPLYEEYKPWEKSDEPSTKKTGKSSEHSAARVSSSGRAER